MNTRLQPSLFDDSSSHGIINVASVPQRSPFRYPGGKTWLVPYIRRWLYCHPVLPHEFIEPFTGGGSIGLTVAFERLAQKVTLVELDDQIAAVWRTILGEDGEWLAHRIAAFHLTQETLQEELAHPVVHLKEKAFHTLLQNRVNRGGILAPGVGRLKQGENGKGIGSRWYPETLCKRILDIQTVKDSITFFEGDGLEILRQNRHRADAIFFLDPPYTEGGKKAGRRLYKYNELDHEALFRLAASLAGDFLMTYEDTEGARRLAQNHGFEICPIAMKNTHHARMTELLIGRNLNWAR